MAKTKKTKKVSVEEARKANEEEVAKSVASWRAEQGLPDLPTGHRRNQPA